MASDANLEIRQTRTDAEKAQKPALSKPLVSSNTPALAVEGHPDGGIQAWCQVLGSFCLYFNTWGLVSSYGSFQVIYEIDKLRQHSSFQISIIGSVQTFLMVFLGLFSGPIYDAGYFRYLLAIGSTLIVVGTLLQSFCVSYWQLLVTQGFVVGLGAGCLCLLSVVVPSMWFSKTLPLANGFAACGSGVGGVVLPIMVREVHSRAGLGWASRSLALLSLVLLGVSNIVLKERGKAEKTRSRRALVDKMAFRDWPYALFVCGCVVVFLGIYTPFVHSQSYAIRHNIASPRLSLYILAILNASSLFGRVLPNIVANQFGPINLIIGTSVVLSITSFCLITASKLDRLLAAIIVYGFATGTFFSLQPTIFVKLTSNTAMIGTRFGMAFAVMSLALLLGPPIAGALLGDTGYLSAWIWAGTTIMAGGILIAISGALTARKQGTMVV